MISAIAGVGGLFIGLWVMFGVQRLIGRFFADSEEQIHEWQMNSIFLGVIFAFFGAVLGAVAAGGGMQEEFMSGMQALGMILGGWVGGVVGVAVLGVIALGFASLFWLCVGLGWLVNRLRFGQRQDA